MVVCTCGYLQGGALVILSWEALREVLVLSTAENISECLPVDFYIQLFHPRKYQLCSRVRPAVYPWAKKNKVSYGCRGKVLQLKTGCPVEDNFKLVTSLEMLKLKLAKLWAVEKLKNQSSKSMHARGRKFGVKTRPQIFLAQNLIFFNGSMAFRFPRNPRKSSSMAFQFL